MYRDSENSGQNTVETWKLFRIPTVNHSYRVDGAMCMITPCLLTAINLHLSAPPPRILQVSKGPVPPRTSKWLWRIAWRCVMGRQRDQMTLNNPDILFIHLSAAWKDGISCNARQNRQCILNICINILCAYIYHIFFIIAFLAIPLTYATCWWRKVYLSR